MRNRFDKQLVQLNDYMLEKGMILPEQRLSLQQTARSIRWKKKLKISA